MSPLRPNWCALVVAAFVLVPATATADMVSFSYSWSVTDNSLYAEGTGPITLSQTAAADGSSISVNYGAGTTALSLAPAGTASATPGADYWSTTPSTIPLGTLTASPLTGPAGNLYFEAYHTLTLHLTDTASGQSGNLSLYGTIYGSTAKDGSTGFSTNAYSYDSIVLGNNVYSADASNSGNSTSAGGDPVPATANIYVTQLGNPNPSSDGGTAAASGAAPEPSTLLLAGCALGFFGRSALRRRRKA